MNDKKESVKTSQPRISIAMATYNGEKFVLQQISSLLNQTLPFFELVVCDDCSTDGTVDLLKSLAANDDRIKICRNDTNLGYYKNFEKVISLCSGDFIALCDQDDIWTEHHLHKLYSIIGDKVLAIGNAMMANSDGTPTGVTIFERKKVDYIPSDECCKVLRPAIYLNPYLGCCMLMTSSFAKKALPFPDGCKFHDVWLVMYACFAGGISVTKEAIMQYRQHGQNATFSHHNKPLRPHGLVGVLKSHLLKRHTLNGRVEILIEVLNREPYLSKGQKSLIHQMINYHQRGFNYRERLKNILFELKHYRSVFSKKGIF